MGSWDDYKREERPRLTAGDYRVEILKAEEKKSKSGNAMIVVSLKPNGYDITINHYLVKNQYFNRNMTDFFDSFNIDDGDFTLMTWTGAIGAARLKEDDQGYMRVHYFISEEKAESLPTWVGTAPERQTVSDFTELEDDGEVPF